MSEIDWSKAPKGATHWERESYGASAGWMKKDGGEWFFLSSEGCWLKHIISNVSAERLQNMVPCPDSSPVWSGEGLPPVGTVCEWKEKTGFQWVSAEVLFISQSSVVMKRADGFEWQMMTVRTVFRPIRTPEQIAADEQSKAVAEMMTHVVHATPIDCELLYRAGFRKQAAK